MVEPLEEGHAVDEVETLAAVAPEVAHDEVHVVIQASKKGVQLRHGASKGGMRRVKERAPYVRG